MENSVLYFAGFPAAVGNSVRVVFGVAIPSKQMTSLPAFVPQEHLLNIVITNHYKLETITGKSIGPITLYKEVR